MRLFVKRCRKDLPAPSNSQLALRLNGMKKLVLIRHAHSPGGDARFSDHERPLSQRGIGDAQKMGRRFFEKKIFPERFYVSDAVRTHTTAMLIAKELGDAESEVVPDRALYNTEADSYFQVIREIAPVVNVAGVVGHNFTISRMLTLLTGAEGYEMSPCSVAVVSCEIENWSEIHPRCGVLTEIFEPE